MCTEGGGKVDGECTEGGECEGEKKTGREKFRLGAKGRYDVGEFAGENEKKGDKRECEKGCVVEKGEGCEGGLFHGFFDGG